MTDIIKALKENDIAEIREFLQCYRGDFRDHRGDTFLSYAIESGKVDVVELLLSAGCDKDIKGKDNYTPLHYAAGFGHLKIVESLINAGANKDAQDDLGRTPLHIAISRNQYEVTKLLIDSGANKDIEDKDGQSPLDLATKSDSKNIVDCFVFNPIKQIPINDNVLVFLDKVRLPLIRSSGIIDPTNNTREWEATHKTDGILVALGEKAKSELSSSIKIGNRVHFKSYQGALARQYVEGLDEPAYYGIILPMSAIVSYEK